MIRATKWKLILTLHTITAFAFGPTRLVSAQQPVQGHFRLPGKLAEALALALGFHGSQQPGSGEQRHEPVQGRRLGDQPRPHARHEDVPVMVGAVKRGIEANYACGPAVILAVKEQQLHA